MHDQHPTRSYVDLNRAGVALMEIVSKPDMRSPQEAGAYLAKLRSILRYVGSCDGNMDQGSMRADVNVSVRKPGDELGTRTETKNVNSVRFVMQTVEIEARRQVEVLEAAGGSSRRRACSILIAARRARCARRKMRTIIAISPIPTCCRSSWTTRSSRRAARACPSCPTPSAAATRGSGAERVQCRVLTADADTARWFEALLAESARVQSKGETGSRARRRPTG
jgi:aspartyl-tRNA(Asn)/glutamyl-tRNA(Gln) amidotransferase subunit B